MNGEDLFASIKENLNGRPGQPIVLGVCGALAQRMGQEAWIVRALAIVLGVFFTFATLVTYIILGFALGETEARTRGLFRGLGIWVREACEKFVGGCRELFGQDKRHNGYH